MLLKTPFLLPHLFWNAEFELIHNTEQSSDIFILQIEILLEFQNKGPVRFNAG